MNILKVISVLLNYPTEDLQTYAKDLSEEINKAKQIPPEMRVKLNGVLHSLLAKDLMDVQEQYSDLFERGRSLSLLLFEHVHGESRDRGQAMVDLMANYERNGFAIAVKELPDFIPMYLEFLSHQSDVDARQGLADVEHILALLSVRLKERQSDYADLFDALLIIAGAKVDLKKLQAEVATEARDDTLEAMDAVWQEEQVKFIGNDDPVGCSSSGNRPSRNQDAHLAQQQSVPIEFVSAQTFAKSKQQQATIKQNSQ